MRAGDDDQRICDRQSKHELRLQKLNLLFYACTFFFSFRVGLNVIVFKLGGIRTFSLEREF